VLQGLFRVAQALYQITITPSKAPVWHEDVRFFEIRDASGAAANAVIGHFYMDLYARDTKRGGAWMDDAITRRRKGGRDPDAGGAPQLQLLAAPRFACGWKPALFTHDEVLTLFHEFGHGLHHLLTRVEDLGVSGINGVEWDAVELPSQFMENFAWEWDVLRHMTRHVDTGASLPRELFDKMIAAKNFQSGLAMLRQIEFAVFDMRLHSEFDPASGRSAQQLLEQVRDHIAVLKPPAYNRFANSFSHIFAGGYAAGYYSYKWAEVLSADAYSFFEENGILDARAGQRFRDEILAVGGSRPAAESFPRLPRARAARRCAAQAQWYDRRVGFMKFRAPLAVLLFARPLLRRSRSSSIAGPTKKGGSTSPIRRRPAIRSQRAEKKRSGNVAERSRASSSARRCEIFR
jgi:oligopeptidase A